MEKKTKVRLDIGGQLFVTTRETLLNFPDTKLSRLNTDSEEYDIESGEFYFDREPELFRPILNLYRSNELHLPRHMCGISLRKEMEFWDISENLVSDCCWKVMYKVEQDEILSRDIDGKGKIYDTVILPSDQSPIRRCRYAVWMFLSQPNSSCFAKVWSCVYFFLVLISVAILVVGTHTTFRVNREIPNNTHLDRITNFTNEKLRMFYRTDIHPALYYLEIICVVIFTVELTVHFLTTPYKMMFLRRVLNILDAIVILCNWCSFIIQASYRNQLLDQISSVILTYTVMKYVSVLRVFRFFKLMEHFRSLQIMVLSLKKSFWELTMMFMCVNVIATLFGIALYIVEFNDDYIPDIPIAIWWATVTMTTVGYGDYIPRSDLGRLIGSFCAITGLIILAMPIAIISTNFNDYFTKSKHRNRQSICKQPRKEPTNRDKKSLSNILALKQCTPLKSKLVIVKPIDGIYN